ncbi:helix-turn-helix domain-containing protein [Flavihumibacter sp. UBA7668]|uniref:helix-turn-helix domain-containing protein n=1 Tax=Flavihumibacter sp. UBA7668 TaxID=1946542 RepID=UPI0025B93610|nr:AraC family transcriptional regulator [Flavihumibacter sp. UBA7668]
MYGNRKFIIKGMVCQRCIKTVENVLEEGGFEAIEIQLGEVTLTGSIGAEEATILEEKLKPYGFSLVEDKRGKMVQMVKALLKEVYGGDYDFPKAFRFSDLVRKRLGTEYDKISTFFSEMEKTTIEKYLIEYRIEKVKEFLVYTEETLADIAFKLNFSSVAHLSRQFKQQTGLTPTYFKEIRRKKLVR